MTSGIMAILSALLLMLICGATCLFARLLAHLFICRLVRVFMHLSEKPLECPFGEVCLAYVTVHEFIL